LVAEELRLDGEQGVACNGALGRDDISEVIGERADDLGLDVVHSSLVRGDRD
jgi:hypothetical protein